MVVAGWHGWEVATLIHGLRCQTTRTRMGQRSQRAETALTQFGIGYTDMQA